jgi:AcrR family transcriptional regulator
VPKLWNKTIESHRREVRDAVLDSVAGLVGEVGLRSVTMSDLAERAGIGRATLYKYFPDVETALNAWHERQVSGHLHQLRSLAHETGEPWDRLTAVLQAYAFIVHDMDHQKAKLGAHGPELAAVLHRGDHVARAQQHLQDFIQEILAKCASEGQVRSDVPVSELARFCLHALGAAGRLTSKVAVRRLLRVILAGLVASR